MALHKVITYIRNIDTNVIFLSILFGFFCIGILFGDGKQYMIDTLASVVIISMYIFATTYLKKNQITPKYIAVLWKINILYLFISTIFSDSIAYSITTVMRFVMAYLIFTLLYEYSNKNYTRYFMIGLIFFSLTSIVVSYFLLIFPVYAQKLPLMNLVYANYGHNHIASILIIIYPLSLFLLTYFSFSKNKIKFLLSFFFYIIIVITEILSFSRGFLFLTGLYTIFQIGLWKNKKFSPKHVFILLIGFVTLGSFMLFSLISIHPIKDTILNGKFEKQIKKPLLAEEGRLQYWTQAIHAITARPIFGSGPGTFFLISKKYQRAPNHYSWFAHNSILQSLVELGIVGSMLQLILLGTVASLIIQRINRNIYVQYITYGLCLLIVSSFFDFTFDFLIIWIIFWSATSIFSVTTNSHEH